MAIKLNPKEIEKARKKPMRKERREQQRQIMLEDIDRNRSGKGVVVIPPPVKQNKDDLNMYFKENHHAAIIERKKWKEVQALLHVRRKAKRGALLQKAPTRFIAKRVKNGVLQGFFFLDSHWSSEERQQFLKIMDSILKN